MVYIFYLCNISLTAHTTEKAVHFKHLIKLFYVRNVFESKSETKVGWLTEASHFSVHHLFLFFSLPTLFVIAKVYFFFITERNVCCYLVFGVCDVLPQSKMELFSWELPLGTQKSVSAQIMCMTKVCAF